MSDRSLPFQRAWGPPPVVAALWLATPLLALSGYGWGWGVACLLGATVAYEGRAKNPARVPVTVLMLMGLAAMALADPEVSTHADLVAERYVGVGVLLLIAYVAVQRLMERVEAHALNSWRAGAGEDPRRHAQRLVYFFGVSTAWGAASTVLSDEPLLPVTVVHTALSTALWLTSSVAFAAVQRRVDALREGRDPRFMVVDDGEQHALVVAREEALPYRDSPGARVCGEIDPAYAPTRPVGWNQRALFGAVGVAALMAMLSHSSDPGGGTRAGSRSRLLVVQRPVPRAIRERFPYKHGFTRIVDVPIPGASVWQGCRGLTCRGAVVVVDDESGHILEAPAAMRRVRDRFPAHLVATRLRLTASFSDVRIDGVTDCGRVLVARVLHMRELRTMALDLSDGEIEQIAHPLTGCEEALRLTAAEVPPPPLDVRR